jgi:crotonobetainyl-CoA:carnitine CoA-transferase CaiB-like acyl-CoA transferase
VAVPGAAAILADWGAEVLKVEDPRRGDPLRDVAATGLLTETPPINPVFLLDNRGKRSVTLDLRQAEGREALERLIVTTDVFLTNFRPAVRRRLGVDYASLRRLNPGLVYCGLTGYGDKGPEADRAGFDYAAFWARTGLMGALGEPGEPPPIPRPGTGDHATALALVAGIAAALFQRQHTGLGQEVSLSLLRTGLWVNSMDIQTFRLTDSTTERVSRRNNPNPLFNTYRTADGEWIQLVIGEPDRYWKAFCEALEAPELARDERFATTSCRARWSEELIALLDPLFAQRTVCEWGERFDARDIYWARVASVRDLSRDPQALDNGAFVPVARPEGPVEVVATPVDFSSQRGRALGPEPQLGEHTEEILRSLDYKEAEIDELRNRGVIAGLREVPALALETPEEQPR